MRGVASLFRLLLLLYPAQFRREFGADMEALFALRLREARADGRCYRFVVRSGTNVVSTALTERWGQMCRRGRAIANRRRRNPMTGFVQDVRHALRSLRRQPGFSLFVVATLAV